MNILSLIILVGFIAFAFFQIKKLVEVIKKRKQLKNDMVSKIDNDSNNKVE